MLNNLLEFSFKDPISENFQVPGWAVIVAAALLLVLIVMIIINAITKNKRKADMDDEAPKGKDKSQVAARDKSDEPAKRKEQRTPVKEKPAAIPTLEKEREAKKAKPVEQKAEEDKPTHSVRTQPAPVTKEEKPSVVVAPKEAAKQPVQTHVAEEKPKVTPKVESKPAAPIQKEEKPKAETAPKKEPEKQVTYVYVPYEAKKEDPKAAQKEYQEYLEEKEDVLDFAHLIEDDAKKPTEPKKVKIKEVPTRPETVEKQDFESEEDVLDLADRIEESAKNKKPAAKASAKKQTLIKVSTGKDGKTPVSGVAVKKQNAKPEDDEDNDSFGKYVLTYHPDKDPVRPYRFELRANNNALLFESEGYKIKPRKASIDAFKGHTQNGSFTIDDDKRGFFRYKLYKKDGTLVGVGENYATKDSCERAVESTKRFALDATKIEDATEANQED